jgi:hypothetical protein
MRTAQSTTFGNPDGTFTTRSYGSPVNWKDPSGAWQVIDTSLASRSDGRLHNKSGPFDVSFAGSSSGSDIATVSKDGVSASFGAPDGASSRSAATSGSQVQFGNVLPGVDLQYQVSSDQSVKEQVVLHSPPAATGDLTYRFPLHLNGLTPRQETDGGVGLYNAAGTKVLGIPAGAMTDSNVDPHSGNAARAPVQISLDQTSSSSAVVVHADGTWLRDPARVYPVSIDPTIQPGYSYWAGDTFVSTRCGGCNYDNPQNYLTNGYHVDDIGCYDGNTGTNRAYLEYDLGPAYGKRITSATWNGFFVWNYYISASTQYWIHPVAATQAWTPGALTWNNQDPTMAPRRPDTIVDSAARNQWRGVDMTSWVTNWASGAWPNSGIELDEGSHENCDQTYWKKLASFENNNGANSHIDITYQSYASSYVFYNSASDPSSDPVNHPPFRGPAANTSTSMTVTVLNNG